MGSSLYLVLAHEHPIASRLLGLIHGCIGNTQDRLDAVPVIGKNSYAYRYGDRADHPPLVRYAERLDVLSELFGAMHNRIARSLGHHQDKLLAAVTADEVFAARRRQQVPAHCAQHGVAGGVTESVVEALEVIDVDHHHPERAAAAPRAALFPAEGLLQVAPVVQASQPVVHDLVLQPQVGLRQLLLRPKALLDLLIQRGSRYLQPRVALGYTPVQLGVEPLEILGLALELGGDRAQVI